MGQDIRIATWNANGIKDKREELEVFLKLQNIDVCLITETHMTKESNLKLKGFKTYQTIHPENQARGGTALVIKENLNHYEEQHLQTMETQLTVVGVKCLNQNLKLGAIYCPPRYNLKKENYKNIMKHLGERFVLGGDFNAKHTDWGSRLITTKGKELRGAVRELGCNYHSTNKPTYWPTDRNKIPDLLDFFITRKVSSHFINIEENFDLNSDHSAVIITISENVIKRESKPFLVNKSTDWESLRIELENNIDLKVRIKTKQQLDAEAVQFMEKIQKAAWNNTREINNHNKITGTNYPMEIRNLVKDKRRARRIWQQTRDPSDKNILNRKSQKLKREILKLKNETFNYFLQNITPGEDTNYSLWKTTKKFKRPNLPNPPIRKADGTWARNSKEKATTFADHLADIFKPNDIETDVPLENPENEDELPILPVSPKEVAKEIKINLKSNKAPGFDLITGEILKQLPRKAITMLAYLINAAIRLKHVPSIWKIAEVIMIPKPGKPPNEAKSYRPISLLPVISKLFEKLLLKRLKPIIEQRHLVPNHQFGFRQKHSTIDQVHRITDIIEKALEGKQICSAIFLDVAQAFDKVWHEGLVVKLKKILPKQFVELLKSYITERLFRVKQEDEYSQLMEINAGVPQGSVLGPVLYLLYTSDLPKFHGLTVATFADDTALLAVGTTLEETTSKLQKGCDKIQEWTKKWKIKLNEMKSTHINFTYKNINNPFRVNLDGILVPYANTAKYLGMTLDTKLKWKEHVKKKRTELDIKFRGMYWLLGRNSQLSIGNKILIYNQILKPVWAYGAQLWGCTKEKHINRIQTFQNKVLRCMVNAPWFIRNSDLHRDLRVQEVATEIRDIALKHKSRLLSHINEEAAKLVNQQNIKRRLQRTKPFELVE